MGCALGVTSLLRSMNEHVRKAGEGTYNFRILATSWSLAVAARSARSVCLERTGHHERVKRRPEFTAITRLRHTRRSLRKRTGPTRNPVGRVSERGVPVAPCDFGAVGKDTELDPRSSSKTAMQNTAEQRRRLGSTTSHDHCRARWSGAKAAAHTSRGSAISHRYPEEQSLFLRGRTRMREASAVGLLSCAQELRPGSELRRGGASRMPILGHNAIKRFGKTDGLAQDPARLVALS